MTGSGTEHKLERQTWTSEIEIFELGDEAEQVEPVRVERRGPVKNEDTIECTCGREFDADEQGRALAAEHLRTARSGGDRHV